MSNEQTNSQGIEKRTQVGTIEVGNARALMPTNLDEVWKLSTIIFKSGVAPQGYKSAEQVFVAMQMGAEVGLTPMAAIQNIPVVNNKPFPQADLLVALAKAKGKLEWIEEKFEGEGDSRRCTVRSKRTDQSRECTPSTFSLADAKKAGLAGKDNWKNYTDRMLLARARSFHMRDYYKDCILGLPTMTAEEAVDVPPRDVTPVKPFGETIEDLIAGSGEAPPSTTPEEPPAPEMPVEGPPSNAPTKSGYPNAPRVSTAKLGKAAQELRDHVFQKAGWDAHALDAWLWGTREQILEELRTAECAEAKIAFDQLISERAAKEIR